MLLVSSLNPSSFQINCTVFRATKWNLTAAVNPKIWPNMMAGHVLSQSLKVHHCLMCYKLNVNVKTSWITGLLPVFLVKTPCGVWKSSHMMTASALYSNLFPNDAEAWLWEACFVRSRLVTLWFNPVYIDEAATEQAWAHRVVLLTASSTAAALKKAKIQDCVKIVSSKIPLNQ